MAVVLRYDGAISRDFFRTIEMLTRLQKARQPKKLSQEPVIAAAAGTMSDLGFGPFCRSAQRPRISLKEKNLLMNRKKTKTSAPDEHRLLEFYRETSDEQTNEIIIGWVENDTLAM